MGHIRVNIDHLRVTVGHPRVTIGHLRVTVGHPRVTIGHLRATLGHLGVTIGYSFLQANIRQTQLSFQTCHVLFHFKNPFVLSIAIFLYPPPKNIIRSLSRSPN